MKIKSITLENIRSYSSGKIDFPDGSVLLSGDIGSGKTSLLLAIDFVLFGLRKGNLSSNALLRKGQNYGFVELNFIVSEKEISIRRNLKKSSSGISQEAGYIVIDGYKEELSPVELKQKVLELFNYPKESLTKTKGLIYNFTVYTPQEEMKSILLADSDERLNILRKVFGVDKYKRVMENSRFLISKLKERKKEFELLSSDFENLSKERLSKKSKVEELSESLKKLKEELNVMNDKINLKKNYVEEIEKKRKEREELKRNKIVLESKLEGLINQRVRNNSVMEVLNKEINDLNKELKEFNVTDLEVINKRISDINEDLRRIEFENKEIGEKIGEFGFIVRNSEEVKLNINKLDLCPICKQKVTTEHKHKISSDEDLRIKDTKALFDKYKENEKENQDLIIELKIKLESLSKSKNEVEIFKVKRNNLESRTKQLNDLLREQNEMKKEIGEINSNKLGIGKLLECIPNVSEEYEKIKFELDELLGIDRKLHSELFAGEREVNLLNERMNELNLEIEKKLKLKERIVKYSEIISYLEKEFISLVSMMEKQIMRKVHSDFDKIFKDWFRILVENEDLEISLDYDFSPLIKQNGYDIEYAHLSGGERTAAALAYRLALNQIINTMMSEINTKELLILDEPTDGFSSEQVDKLRIVLEELKIEQVIIVSHDPKIESFVDNVIKFEKKEGNSFTS
ncbi:AAA family ATPase [Candidatus Woesearchaeota archaeon]|jgi:DNA repair protein SbcC/Rad50|nr:AAA family ATPase [Candidatus Woesearchaeota archaeon]MBT4321623.1 AAA family ATPase [Candidatus Woesearchaeota archaeon]MBT4631066.1 AAA family ATPase [Candidatus Woesearchaeota archaeon]